MIKELCNKLRDVEEVSKRDTEEKMHLLKNEFEHKLHLLEQEIKEIQSNKSQHNNIIVKEKEAIWNNNVTLPQAIALLIAMLVIVLLLKLIVVYYK